MYRNTGAAIQYIAILSANISIHRLLFFVFTLAMIDLQNGYLAV